MPDEQIIYLDPNDELTKVRERIEEIPARHIILVVPQQTQLRSHVGWRLLHARAREMGKDVLVISTDRQVRAVAKAAGFKVADSQESPISSKTRPGSRPSRGGIGGGRTTQRPRTQSGRGAIENRAPRQREQLPPRTKPGQDQPAQNTWREAESRLSRAEETRTGQGKAAAPSPFTIEEDEEFEQPYEFRVDATQSTTARPMIPRHEEEEPDPFIEDYRTSQRIREAAQSARTGEGTRPADERQVREPASAMPGPRNTVPPPNQLNPDPFAEMEDITPVSLPEQRGSTFVHDVDEGIPDISDIPTDVHEIEYLGDQGDFVGTQNIPPRQWPDAIINEPQEDLPRVHGARPRSSRSGALPRKQVPDFGEEDLLPPVEDQPTLTPTYQPRPSGALRGGSRGAQPAAQGPQAPLGQQRPVRNVSTRPAPPPSRVTPRIGTPVAPTPTARRADRTPGRRGSRVAAVILVCLLLLLLVGIGLLYFNTTATVTITVPSQSLSLSTIKLNATSNPKVKSNVMSLVLSSDLSVTGQGTATGTTPQGKSPATGNVTFTNNGPQQLIIPTGTLISTTASPGSTGILFATTAQAPVGVTTPVPVPVQAQTPGDAGNVGPNAINIIPAESITKIAAFNNVPSSTIRLSVNNPTGLQGGGTINVPAATKGDIQALATSLQQKLQARVNAWLNGQLHSGDLRGTVFPDVLGSATPLKQEHLIQAPGPGQALTGTSFTGQLTVHVSVLVVHYADLVTAVQKQLNAEALKMHPPYVLATQIPITLGKKVTTAASKDGTSLAITLSATGRVVQQVNNIDDIRSLIAGKTRDQAISEISNGDAGIHSVQSVDIVVSPSILNLMPFRTEHIQIIIKPGQPPSGIPNG